VFVLTHHERPSFTLADTTFRFLNATPTEALRRAKEAAGGLDVRIGGGPTTIRAFLDAGLIDELHIAVAPVTIGSGVRLWEAPDEFDDRFHHEAIPSPSGVTHHLLWRRETPTRTDRAAAWVGATPEVLFAALTDAGGYPAWLPPAGMTGTVFDADMRAGGGDRMILRYDDTEVAGKVGDGSDAIGVRVVELTPPRRLVQTVDFESADPAFGGTMTMTWTLTPAAGGTTVELEAADVPPGITAEDHEAGMAATLANLARHLGVAAQ
jgi:uncharacterized protein YndB with AHSA1/START domain